MSEPKYYIRGLSELDLILLVNAMQVYRVPVEPNAAFPIEKVHSAIALRRKLNSILTAVLTENATSHKIQIPE